MLACHVLCKKFKKDSQTILATNDSTMGKTITASIFHDLKYLFLNRNVF
jgi:hypothetical protein